MKVKQGCLDVGDLQQSSRRVAMLVPAQRAPDLPFVNSVCGSQRGNLAANFTREWPIRVEMCVWTVFSVMSWL